MGIHRPKGTQDIIPGTIEKWHFIEAQIRKICSEYGFQEIRTPIFESTELFQRGVGETTDIVNKEMYKIGRASCRERVCQYV
jgi:histidyl-tRNA synthetase